MKIESLYIVLFVNQYLKPQKEETINYLFIDYFVRESNENETFQLSPVKWSNALFSLSFDS